MMRNLLFLFFITLSFSLQAQITVSPEQISLLGNPSEDIITFKFDLTNTTDADINLYWTIERIGDFPTAWSTQVCDFQLCYGENIDTINFELPNTLKAGETRDFKIYLLPYQTEGTADLMFKIYNNAELDNPLVEMSTDQILVNTTTSVADRNLKEIYAYPNPSQNYFQISDDEDINKVVIYSIVGKKLRELDHYKGKSHNIDFLQEGPYLIKLFDKRKEWVKSIRLQKI